MTFRRTQVFDSRDYTDRVLDYSIAEHRRRLFAFAGDETVLIQVFPYLKGNQFRLTPHGIQFSAELYDALGVAGYETFRTVAHRVREMSDEDLGQFSLQVAADLARALILLLEDASQDDIKSIEKQEIAADVFESLRRVLPFDEEPDATPTLTMREISRRRLQ